MDTDRCGMNAASSARRTVRRMSRQYRKVETNVPSTIWVVVSLMKLWSRRGPSCDDVSDRVTRVMEKTTPVMVIIDPATVPQNGGRSLGITGEDPVQAKHRPVLHRLIERDAYEGHRHSACGHDCRDEPETGPDAIPVLENLRSHDAGTSVIRTILLQPTFALRGHRRAKRRPNRPAIFPRRAPPAPPGAPPRIPPLPPATTGSAWRGCGVRAA